MRTRRRRCSVHRALRRTHGGGSSSRRTKPAWKVPPGRPSRPLQPTSAVAFRPSTQHRPGRFLASPAPTSGVRPSRPIPVPLPPIARSTTPPSRSRPTRGCRRRWIACRALTIGRRSMRTSGPAPALPSCDVPACTERRPSRSQHPSPSPSPSRTCRSQHPSPSPSRTCRSSRSQHPSPSRSLMCHCLRHPSRRSCRLPRRPTSRSGTPEASRAHSASPTSRLPRLSRRCRHHHSWAARLPACRCQPRPYRPRHR
jgi:hypothetical protein